MEAKSIRFWHFTTTDSSCAAVSRLTQSCLRPPFTSTSLLARDLSTLPIRAIDEVIEADGADNNLTH